MADTGIYWSLRGVILPDIVLNLKGYLCMLSEAQYPMLRGSSGQKSAIVRRSLFTARISLICLSRLNVTAYDVAVCRRKTELLLAFPRLYP
jgi:hypothetical protein